MWRRAPPWPDGKWQPTITGNRITGGYYGIYLSTIDAGVTTTIDSNVVTGTGYAALDLSLASGAVAGKWNNIKSNTQYGVYNGGALGSRSLTAGRLVGNLAYAVYNVGNVAFDARNNWWGDPGGPGVNGANANSANVDASNPQGTNPEGGVVPAAPPLIAAASRPAPLAGVTVRPSRLMAVSPDPTAADAATRRAEQAERRAAKDAARAAHLQAERRRAPQRVPLPRIRRH